MATTQVFKFVGWAPDADTTTPGVMINASGLVPTPYGFKGAPEPASTGVDALAAACRGAAHCQNLAGTYRLIAGAATRLYELSGTTWTDRSRGANYALATDDRWSIVAYADTIIAATPTAVIQRSTGAAFADVAGSPQAKFIESSQGFVVAFNTSSFTDEWHCCAYLDPTDWATSVSTQCTKGRLVDTPGPFTAAKRFGDKLVAYKANSMYLGTYVGAPEVWRWDRITDAVGCVGQEAVVDTPHGHIFLANDGLYLYDGTTPRQIGVGTIRNWIAQAIPGAYRFKTMMFLDRINMAIWMYFVPVAGTTVTSGITMSDDGARFGGILYTSSYDPVEAVLPYVISGVETPSIFTDTHTLKKLTGACTFASISGHDVGSDDLYSFCSNVTIKYRSAATTGVGMTFNYKDELGVSRTLDSLTESTPHDGRYDCRITARWHNFNLTPRSDFEIIGFSVNLTPAGRR